MARMTIDRAVEILGEASRDVLTNDAEFKVACAMGKHALIGLRGRKNPFEGEGRPIRLEHPHVRRVRPAFLEQKP